MKRLCEKCKVRPPRKVRVGCLWRWFCYTCWRY